MVPGPIFNEVFFSLKDDFVSNKVDSTVSRVEVLYLLTRLEIFNPQHQLFSAELEKHLEECHVDIANGNYSSILEELEQNDIFKDAFKVSDLFLFIVILSSIKSRIEVPPSKERCAMLKSQGLPSSFYVVNIMIF